MKFFTHKYLSAPDATLVEIATGGERMAAIIRTVIIGILLFGSILAALVIKEIHMELVIGIAAVSIAFLASLVLLYISTISTRISKRHFIISAVDISIVTISLLFFAILGKPEIAINSMVNWEVYLFFIIGSCIYFDTRVCIFTGLLAILQYSILLVWVTQTWDMTQYDSPHGVYSAINWYIQFLRFNLLFCATAIALGIVIRCRKLLSLSGTDTLTGLDNRRVVEARLQQEISRALRDSSVFSVVYLDIDDFKQFNDKWGHTVGDLALKYFSSVLKNQLRIEDIVSRWGGEEFVIVLLNTDRHLAKILIERIQENLRTEPLQLQHGDEILKFSAGISQFLGDGIHHAELIDKADARLKIAKETGRDKVVIKDKD